MLHATSIEERLRQDDVDAFEEVYLEHKMAFINYARKFQLNEEELLDIYQDAVIALHQNFVTQQKVLIDSNLKTYLFGIGKNKIYNRLKELNKFRIVDKAPEEFQEIELDEINLTEEQNKLSKHFTEISESCQRLLKMYYYRNLTIKEIVSLTDYKDENTVKSSKSRCMKRLTTLIKNG